MSNYVAHRIWAKGSRRDIASLISQYMIDFEDAYTQEKMEFLDFDKIIPVPDIVEKTQAGSQANQGAYLLQVLADEACYDLSYDKKINRSQGEDVYLAIRRFLQEQPNYQHYGQLQLQCLAETGFKDWYLWKVEHWGTKCGPIKGEIVSIEQDKGVINLELTMDTAWYSPEPIFEKLASIFPQIRFWIVCFDEGWNFAGSGSYNYPQEIDGLKFEVPQSKQSHWRWFYQKVYGHECPDFQED
jgi:hypothetical protein